MCSTCMNIVDIMSASMAIVFRNCSPSENMKRTIVWLNEELTRPSHWTVSYV